MHCPTVLYPTEIFTSLTRQRSVSIESYGVHNGMNIEYNENNIFSNKTPEYLEIIRQLIMHNHDHNQHKILRTPVIHSTESAHLPKLQSHAARYWMGIIASERYCRGPRGDGLKLDTITGQRGSCDDDLEISRSGLISLPNNQWPANQKVAFTPQTIR